MLKEEKLLREFISIIIEEDESSSGDTTQSEKITFRDLRGFFANTQKNKKAKKFVKFGLKFAKSVLKGGALGSLVNALPVDLEGMAEEAAMNALEEIMQKAGASEKGPLKALAKFYGINDKPGAKYVSLPNEVSNLVADDVEKKFVEYFKEIIFDASAYPDNEVVPENFAEIEFEKYTKEVDKKTKGASASKS